MANELQVLGIDIGGTGIKGAVVEVYTGVIVGEKMTLPTPRPATPEAMARQVAAIVKHFEWTGLLGCGFPAALRHGVAYTAANIDPSCKGADIRAHFHKATGLEQILVLNDADAAGLAEMAFGSGKGHRGSVMILTVGTGIGSALFREGILFPNTELGHLPFRGKAAEDYASGAAYSREELTYALWAERFNDYLQLLENLFWPDLFIIGGGMSRNFDDFVHLLEVKAPIQPASMHNDAGIVGAAVEAARLFR